MGVKRALKDFSSRLKDLLPQGARRALRRGKIEALGRHYSSDLNRLARLYNTDKWGAHFYTQYYQRFFAPLRKQPLKILEIGVGGYSNASDGGGSLRMWKKFFPKAHIVGIDLYDKSQFSEHRITVLQCDQTDAVKLAEISATHGPFDIIIDDGSHRSEHIIQTFHILFPLLKDPGYYVVEDLQTAYWPSWGGIHGKSSMDFLKSLVDGLNHTENPFPKEVTYFDLHIREMAFFHNLCILRKADNNDPTNVPDVLAEEVNMLREAEGAAASADA